MQIAKALLAATLLLQISLPARAESGKKPVDSKAIERGRYLVKVGGCNDCHTPGYSMANGNIPEAQWLIGDAVGWHGPWGTTYSTNLRILLGSMSESEWIKLARTSQARPPMPWYTLKEMTEEDLRALYKFIRSLGPSGQAAPDYLAPDKLPSPPFIDFPAPQTSGMNR